MGGGKRASVWTAGVALAGLAIGAGLIPAANGAPVESAPIKPVLHQLTAQDQADTDAFWTTERMKNAQPLDGSPARSSSPAPAIPGNAGGDAGPADSIVGDGLQTDLADKVGRLYAVVG